MQPIIKYRELDWWVWLFIEVAMGVGLLGWRVGYVLAVLISAASLLHKALVDRTTARFATQVRVVWLGLVLLGMLAPLRWLFILLFLGLVLVLLFDRCGIARLLIKMPWNRGVELR